jgi:hypothetical protein
MLKSWKYAAGVALLLIAGFVVFFSSPETKQALLGSAEQLLEHYDDAVDDAQGEHDDEHAAETHEAMTVKLSADALEYAGVETQQLVASEYLPEFKAQVRVLALGALLTLRSQINQATSAIELAKVQQQTAADELARLTQLNEQAGAVAAKRIIHATASLREAEATLAAARIQLGDLQSQAQQDWGKQIPTWLNSSGSDRLEQLLKHQQSLLLVTLPVGHSLPKHIEQVRIHLSGSQQQSLAALVGPAYVSDPLVQGETYYFTTATGNLRPGMRLEAWVAEHTNAVTGVMIPDAAIVWYSGQAWVYVEAEAGEFHRRSLKNAVTVPGGMFSETDFNAGEMLVVAGAQMLLSEEFKWQIEDEDDD